MDYIENTCKNYVDSPLIRVLMQLIPLGIGSAIDVGICANVKRISDMRQREFFNELADGSVILDETLIENENFLHCFFSTYKYAIDSRKKEKIEMFARLLKASLNEDVFTDTDEYEEYLQILNELTYREFLMLVKLDNFENDYPHKQEESDLQRLERFWEQYKNELIEELKVPEDEIDAMMIRLNRTGCYEIFSGSYMADIVGGKGKVTPTFRRLRKLVSDQAAI
ncbi:hypothetical protein [Acetobacterium sp.]|uniref:hypothetical protein n=1 Tax=Acetobacterium sp. TaxID=1872094 RepID=UPI0027182E0E|nr:hypothetical protein [Acetobacterium sp.]MDO9491256.1 hypothetical protein [Acetobacterium sp.]